MLECVGTLGSCTHYSIFQSTLASVQRIKGPIRRLKSLPGYKKIEIDEGNISTMPYKDIYLDFKLGSTHHSVVDGSTFFLQRFERNHRLFED